MPNLNQSGEPDKGESSRAADAGGAGRSSTRQRVLLVLLLALFGVAALTLRDDLTALLTSLIAPAAPASSGPVTLAPEDPGGPAERAAEGPGYFLDLASGELFTHDRAAFSPIANPAGQPGRGVRAIVFACGTCDEASRFVGYVVRYSPAAVEALRVMEAPGAENRPDLDALRRRADAGTYVAAIDDSSSADAAMADGAPAGPRWVVRDSAAGRTVLESPQARCAGRTPQTCEP